MASENQIRIPEIKESHNDLIALIERKGFNVPVPNKVTGFRVGHVYAINPKPNHPSTYGSTLEHMSHRDCPLPVAYAHYGVFILVNTNKTALAEYHVELKTTVESWLKKFKK